MGADNLSGFHRWRGWERIAGLVPFAVIDRPGSTFAATASPAAHALSAARIPESAAAGLAGLPPPAWVFLHGPRLFVSSTKLRGNGSHGGR